MLANVKQLFALDGWLVGWSRCRLVEDRADCRRFHHRSEIRTAPAAGRSFGCAIPDYGATSSMISGPAFAPRNRRGGTLQVAALACPLRHLTNGIACRSSGNPERTAA
jgi:hypothetical protein